MDRMEMRNDCSTIELMFSLPAGLLSFVMLSSGPIRLMAQVSLMLRWIHPFGRSASWILLLTWIGICVWGPSLVSSLGLMVMTNVVFGVSLLVGWLKTSATKQQRSGNNVSHSPHLLATTLDSIQIIVDHLNLISTDLRPLNQLLSWSNHHQSVLATRACLTSLPISWLISHLIPTRLIFLLLGSLAIIWSSNWFRLLRTLLWRSALLRWSSRLAFDILILGGAHFSSTYRLGAHHHHHITLWPPLLKLFQSPNQIPTCSPGPQLDQDHHQNLQSDHLAANAEDVQEIEFRFTIFENQRWWMGLDWTSTLLPHERPNWSDYLHRPVSSPTNFKLPPAVLSPVEPALGCQRRVEWRWVDPDWKIVDAYPPAHHHHAQPDRSKIVSAQAGRLSIKSLGKRTPSASKDKDKDKQVLMSSPIESPKLHHHPYHDMLIPRLDHPSRSPSSSTDLDSEIVHQCAQALGQDAGIVEGQDPDEGWDVDSNGWQYGDNHWEKLSRKAGIGRYTRRRAWFRRAVMVTSVMRQEGGPTEPLSSSTLGIDGSVAGEVDAKTSGVVESRTAGSLRNRGPKSVVA